jgi:multiple sugar transport system permease protein
MSTTTTVGTAGYGLARLRRFSLNRADRRKLIVGLLFISPWIVGFLAFTLLPMLTSLFYSFTNYSVLSPAQFVGIQNYIGLFQDDMFRTSLANTIYFVFIGVPVGFVVAFLLANLLNQPVRFRAIFRTVFFLPAVTPLVAVAMVWLWTYDTQFGLIDGFLAGHGLPAIPWLSSPQWAKPSIIIIQAWGQGTTIVIFLAALQGVPTNLYEAATIDGAKAIRRFFHVTVPMCTPAMFFVLITGLITAFQSFTLPWILTQGGPSNSTELYGVYMYQNAFVDFKMGYASAQAWILFIIIMCLSLIMVKVSGRWVYYE